ncbi:MAG TPA: PQQ-dependent sugar dehydrogenase [Candidatus Krumholzibacteria bacterium]
MISPPMMSCRRALLVSALLVAADPPFARAQYQLEPAYPGLDFTSPTDIQPANDGTNRMFVVEKRGFIWVFENDVQTTTAKPFLDIRTKVRNYGEAGLLGLAFHPSYRTNDEFFVFYVSAEPMRTIVARYTVSADPDVADAASEVILIDNPQINPFHCGGQLAFGNDGYLYIAMGDNRVDTNAQDLTTLPGSILRVDVDPDMPPIPYPPYAIPPDNPFANAGGGVRPEIYAYGFRNPWRFWIDEFTNDFWVCDVGEDKWEEIDLISRGRNYGWPLMEGPMCFPTGSPCDTTGKSLQLPLYAYSHSEGDAIVGGARYRSPRLPELNGIFVFADYFSHMVWGLHYDGAAPPERFELAGHDHVMLTVGTSASGDVLIGASDGNIYRLGRAATGVGDAPASARLLGNFPNPFNPSTTIRFSLERSARIRLDIVTVTGELVRHFEISRAGAGLHDITWRGETDGGIRVASGVYFCRLVVDGVAAGTARMVLVQ